MQTDGPAEDVIEVSIFGPGKGESVLVHLGRNRWIIVDSCIDQRGDFVPALRYLDRIGVDIASSVLMVVATHAHDDHFAGIAQVLRASEAAVFVCSAALTSEEFIALTEIDRRLQIGLRVRAFSEYREIFQIVRSRSASDPSFKPLKHALELRPLLEVEDYVPCRIMALSPSDEAFRRSLKALAHSFPTPGAPRRLARIDPNELAIALWMDVGEKAILLGADLLNGPSGCGWEGVLTSFTPKMEASVFKVPHHGSVTGHHPAIWEKLVGDSPIALLTPFRGGVKPLPSVEDRNRICSLTSEAFITAGVRRPAPPRNVRKEAAALGPLARNVREQWGSAGQVRARSRIGNNEWAVDYFSPAHRLCET